MGEVCYRSAFFFETFIIPKLWIKGAWEVSFHAHCLGGPKTLRTFLQSCSRGGGDKSYRHADQWWPEADLLNVQNFVKSYLGPIACIGINSKSVRNSFACKRHWKEKGYNFQNCLPAWRKLNSYHWQCKVLHTTKSYNLSAFCFGWRRQSKKLMRGWNVSPSVFFCPVDVHPLRTTRAKNPINTDPPSQTSHLLGIWSKYINIIGPSSVLYRLVKSTLRVKCFARFFGFLLSVEPLWTFLTLFELAIPWVISHKLRLSINKRPTGHLNRSKKMSTRRTRTRSVKQKLWNFIVTCEQ